MTTIIGVTYPDGLVMASDLKAISIDGVISEEKKIDYANKLIWGFGGMLYDSRISGLVSRKIKEFCKTCNIEEVVDSVLGELMREVNKKIKEDASSRFPKSLAYNAGMYGLFGALYDNKFGLWYFNGRELTRRNSNGGVSSTGTTHISYKSTYEEARESAIKVVRMFSGSGISAFHMTRTEIREIA